MIRIAIALLALSSAAAAWAAPEFTAPPTADRDGDKVTISFAVGEATDAEVAILDGAGKVVRHLAAGLLGDNAPEPFARGRLDQSLVWDGTDDAGKRVDPAGCRVRVRLGLEATFGRLIGEPDDVVGGPVTAIGVGPGGEVFVLSNTDKQAGTTIFVLSREGEYLRTILPTPANVPDEKLGDLPRVKLNDGTRVPVVYQAYIADTAPYLSGIRGQQIAVSGEGQLVFASGGNDWTDQQVPRHVLTLNRDGSTPEGVGFVGPNLGPESRYSVGLRRQQMALSPDGKTLYFAGMGRAARGKTPATGIHAIGRLTWDSEGPEAFIGDPDEPGDGERLNDPSSVATDAQGNIYVADTGNNRIAAFSPAGKLLGETKVERPGMLAVHPPTGTLYVLTLPTGRRWEPHSLIKFDKAVGGKEVARHDFSGRGAVMTVDPESKPARLYLNYDPAWAKPQLLLPLTDRGDKLEAGDDLLAKFNRRFSAPMFVDIDRNLGRLYVGDFSRQVKAVDIATGKVAAWKGVSEAVVAPDGHVFALMGYGTNAVERFTPDGKPANFPGSDTNKIEVTYRAGLPHVGVRGLTVAPSGDLYVYSDRNMGGPVTLQRVGPDGKSKNDALVGGIPHDSANGVAVDRAGNVYLGINVHKPDALYPPAFSGIVPELAWINIYSPKHSSWYTAWEQRDWPPLPWSRAYLNFYLYHYGNIFKFGPDGGNFVSAGKPAAGGKPNARPEGVPADAEEFRDSYLAKVVWGSGHLWRYPGFALSASRTQSWGDPGCSCMTSRFGMGPYERLFVPDVFRFSVGVLDRAGNEILRFGAYGNADSAGPGSALPEPSIAFAFPNAVAVGEDEAYVIDRKNRRIVVVKLTHAAEGACAIK